MAKEVEKKLAFGFESMGEQQVKNIAEPVPAYRVVLDGTGRCRKAGDLARSTPLRLPPSAAALADLSVGSRRLVWLVRSRPDAMLAERRDTPITCGAAVRQHERRPGLDYLGHGIAEDIITMLVELPEHPGASPARQASSTDKPIEVRQIAEDLTSAMSSKAASKGGGQVRVTAQLINAAPANTSGPTALTRRALNPVAMQDDIANKIYDSIGGMSGEIRQDDDQKAWQGQRQVWKNTTTISAATAFLQSRRRQRGRARRIWQEGLAKNPELLVPATKIGLDLLCRTLRTLRVCRSLGATSISLGNWRKRAEPTRTNRGLRPGSYHWLMANLYQWHEGDFQRSVARARRRSSGTGTIRFRVQMLLARCERARTRVGIPLVEARSAMIPRRRDGIPVPGGRLLPGRPARGRDRCVQQHGPMPWANQYLAAAEVRVGKLAEAQAQYRRIAEAVPSSSIKSEATWPSGRHPQMVKHLLEPYLDDLRKAGMPEG